MAETTAQCLLSSIDSSDKTVKKRLAETNGRGSQYAAFAAEVVAENHKCVACLPELFAFQREFARQSPVTVRMRFLREFTEEFSVQPDP